MMIFNVVLYFSQKRLKVMDIKRKLMNTNEVFEDRQGRSVIASICSAVLSSIKILRVLSLMTQSALQMRPPPLIRGQK